MPDAAALDHRDANMRALAVNHVRSAIAHAADVGAEIAYVIPGADARPAALLRYQDSVAQLAAAAADHEIKLAVEHFPGTALPTAAETLEFIRQAEQDNLYLLYDSGHIQMSGEDPAAVIANAGDKLGYVHFDDNDGISDLHWSLLDGVMTEESVIASFQAMAEAGYGGAVSLELSPQLPAVRRALEASRDILLRAQFA
jgi:sugar phosphate isomerase/epimerase